MTREEAIQAWKCMRSEIDNENWLFVGTINPQMVDMAIEALQARPTGEWIDRSDHGRIKYPWWESCECNQCGEYGSGAYNYCPSCGAKMEGGAE